MSTPDPTAPAPEPGHPAGSGWHPGWTAGESWPTGPHSESVPAVLPPPVAAGSAGYPVRFQPVSPMPDGPRRYPQMLRGARYRWWKPLLSLLLTGLFAITLMVLATGVVVVAGLVSGARDIVAYVVETTGNTRSIDPVGFIYINLSLAVLIPAVMWANWLVHGIRPRFVSSVLGGIRWRWLLRCVLIVLPIWAVYIGLGALTEPPNGARPDHWVLLLVISLLLSPLQSAGEEYLFRGWVLQNVGAWFRRPVVGLVVSLIISASLFAAAHTSPDPWILITLGSLAVASGLAAWWTGGLEAGIVMHATNNVLTFFVVIIFGGFQEAFVNPATTGTPVAALIAIVVEGAAVALIVWQAKKIGLQRSYEPPASAAASPAPALLSPPAVWNPIPSINQTP